MKYANVKVYKVKFLNYTNCMEDTVSKNDEDMCFIDIPQESRPYILLREDQLELYRIYGNGYESIEYVGNMIEEDR